MHPALGHCENESGRAGNSGLLPGIPLEGVRNTRLERVAATQLLGVAAHQVTKCRRWAIVLSPVQDAFFESNRKLPML